jgi:hypothetical protein
MLGVAKRLGPFEFADISTERLLKLRDEYRAGRVKSNESLIPRRARLNAVNCKMLVAIVSAVSAHETDWAG